MQHIPLVCTQLTTIASFWPKNSTKKKKISWICCHLCQNVQAFILTKTYTIGRLANTPYHVSKSLSKFSMIYVGWANCYIQTEWRQLLFNALEVCWQHWVGFTWVAIICFVRPREKRRKKEATTERRIERDIYSFFNTANLIRIEQTVRSPFEWIKLPQQQIYHMTLTRNT